VGTVDDFQGQESRVVFVSTTLSRPESLPPPPAAAPPGAAARGGGAGGGGGEGAAEEEGEGEGGAGGGPYQDLSIGFWHTPKVGRGARPRVGGQGAGRRAREGA
jgi:hypothetical protein